MVFILLMLGWGLALGATLNVILLIDFVLPLLSSGHRLGSTVALVVVVVLNSMAWWTVQQWLSPFLGG